MLFLPLKRCLLNRSAFRLTLWLTGGSMALQVVLLRAPASVLAADDAIQVAKVAQSITVSIDGAVQGSGVLVEQQGNRYTVLTAWHVIGDNRPGEEVAIATSDGLSHSADSRTMHRLASNVDLGVITFEASNRYPIASLGESRDVAIGEKIYVSGFPLPTAAVPVRILRFLNGDVQANATMAIPNGYQLLYSNATMPGMSGGAVLNGRGQLVGIHGQGETENKATEQEGVFVKTGTNQAVPIAFFREYQKAVTFIARNPQAVQPSLQSTESTPVVLTKPQSQPEPVVVPVPASTPMPVAFTPAPSQLMLQSRPQSADDYLAQARQLFTQRGNEQQIIELMRDSIALKPTALAYFYRAKAKHDKGDVMGAMNDYNEALRLNPAIGAKAAKRGSSTGESIQGKVMATRLAMEQLPRGAAVIDTSCRDVQMGPDNFKTRCTVTYTTDSVE